MEPLLRQVSFLGGMNRLYDATKLDRNSYPLLINGRVRDNVVTPTNKHKLMQSVGGKVQLLVEAGNYLLTVISGKAYLLDLTSNLGFQYVSGWQPMSSSVEKFYSARVPTTFSFFSRTGEPDVMRKNFTGTIAGYPECIIVQDGINQPQAVFPDGTSRVLGTYAQWTQDVPNYVPIGTIMTYSGTKLYIVAPDGHTIYHSVSGRPTDFVINLTTKGDKGGDASTTATSAGYNQVTSLFPLDDGNLGVTTLYSTSIITLDFNNTTFGEPNFLPAVAFPVGTVNERSYAHVLGDTTNIAPAGIQSFNFAQYSKIRTNNGPFGARLQNLLLTPQVNTCAVTFGDYALYSLNTIFGNGVIVYDMMASTFVSLDLDFGDVRQFASTLVDGKVRLFFYTSDNKIYEAYAGSLSSKAALYIGDFAQGVRSIIHHACVTYTNIKSSGEVRVSLYGDKQLLHTATQQVNSSYVTPVGNIVPPYALNDVPEQVFFNFESLPNVGQFGLYIEWNFNGSVEVVDVYGVANNMWNPKQVPGVSAAESAYVVLGNFTLGPELNSGSIIYTQPNAYYYFAPLTSTSWLTNGVDLITSAGVFQAQGEYVSTGDLSSVKSADNAMRVWFAALSQTSSQVAGVIFLGDTDRVLQNVITDGLNYYGCLGDRDYNSLSSFAFARYGYFNLSQASLVAFNCGYKYPDYTTVVEANGNTLNSNQLDYLTTNAQQNDLQKVVLCHLPPYSAEASCAPGFAQFRGLFSDLNPAFVLSGHSFSYERYVVNNVRHVNLGLSGADVQGAQTAGDVAPDVFVTGAPAYGVLTTSQMDLRLHVYDVDNNLIDFVQA